MKKTFRILTSLLLSAFLAVALITIGGCKQNTDDATKTKTEQSEKTETEQKDDNQSDSESDNQKEENSKIKTKSLYISLFSKS